MTHRKTQRIVWIAVIPIKELKYKTGWNSADQQFADKMVQYEMVPGSIHFCDVMCPALKGKPLERDLRGGGARTSRTS